MSTIKDVSRLSKVAISTVSNVLSGKKYVSEELRTRILAACKELNYSTNVMASALVTHRTNLIGVFLTAKKNQFDTFYSDLLHGICVAGNENGVNPILYYNVLDAEGLTQLLLPGKGIMDGAIILTPSENDFRLERFRQDNLKHVIIGSPEKEHQKDGGSYYIDADNEDICYKMTKHLIEQGHRRILFVSGLKEYTICIDRERGFFKAVKECGLIEEEQKVCNLLEGEKNGRRIFEEVSGDFSAVLLDSSNLIPGARKYAERIGKTVGEDFAIVSLGGDMHTQYETDITTMYVDYYQVGYQSAEMLFDLIENKPVQPSFLHNYYTIEYRKSSEFQI